MHKIFLSVVAYVAFVGSALAQASPPPAEVHGEPVSALMFFTLGAALLLAIGSFGWFLRKSSNRAAADRVLNPNNPRNQ